MDPTTENPGMQSEKPDEAQSTSIGKILRDARESHGYSVVDVAAQIKFAPRQIEALEADDFDNLPETAFLRGFVRSYSKILQIDANEVLKYLPQSKGVAEPVQVRAPAASPTKVPFSSTVKVAFPGVHPSHKQNLILLSSALLMGVVAVVFAFWHFSSPTETAKITKVESPVSLPAETQALSESPDLKDEVTETAQTKDAKAESLKSADKASARTETTAPAQEKQKTKSADSVKQTDTANINKPKIDQPESQAVTKIAPADSEDVSASPTRSGRVRLVFDEESWTEITGYDGKLISSQIYSRGSELNMEVPLPLSLVIGHAATTHLYLDGELVDLAPYINRSSEVARLTLE